MKILPNPLLYLVLSLEHCDKRDPKEIALSALEGGVKAIQLRSSESSDKSLIKIGKKIKQLCCRFNSMFIVNNRPDIAVILESDGVHLGQDDISPEEARKIVGKDVVVGLSCHNLEQTKSADRKNVNYIGIGPIYNTLTKQMNNPALGPLFLHNIKDLDIPFVAIGGITPENVSKIVSAGCRRIAVVTGLTKTENVGQQAVRYNQILQED